MGLEPRLEATVAAGRAELTFSVANVGAEPITFRFAGDAAAEIVVRTDGETVWRWRDERSEADAGMPLRDQELGPGDTVVHRATWSNPPAGEYDAVAMVAARNVDEVARTTFTV